MALWDEQDCMSTLTSFRDLRVWQAAMDLATSVYTETVSMPERERYGLTSQLRRATVSVAANIAEGYGRATRGEYLQFLGTANGSLCEVMTLLILVQRLNLLAHADELLRDAQDVSQILTRLRQSLQRKIAKESVRPYGD
jgi:four helix bundle protein